LLLDGVFDLRLSG
jgi:hypothetical protein